MWEKQTGRVGISGWVKVYIEIDVLIPKETYAYQKTRMDTQRGVLIHNEKYLYDMRQWVCEHVSEGVCAYECDICTKRDIYISKKS